MHLKKSRKEISLESYRDTHKALSRDSSSNLNLLLNICST